MAGAANAAEVWRIYNRTTLSREADWETMPRKTSSPCAPPVTDLYIPRKYRP